MIEDCYLIMIRGTGYRGGVGPRGWGGMTDITAVLERAGLFERVGTLIKCLSTANGSTRSPHPTCDQQWAMGSLRGMG